MWRGENRDFSGTSIRNSDVDEIMMLPDVPCGHFAIGTLSETCLKDAVFNINVTTQKVTKSKNVNFCLDIKHLYHKQILFWLD